MYNIKQILQREKIITVHGTHTKNVKKLRGNK